MADHNIKLDPGAAALLDALHGAGYAAYAVGGCVRDSLLGLTPHDWDLCTSALPRQVLDRFGKEQCIPTGLQHGTVTVKYGGKLYETTTFRTEGSYSDGRHPDSVAFVPDVKEDLARAIIDTLPEGLPEVSTRLAALLLPLGEQGTRKALKQLRCSNALIEEVTTLVREAGLVPEEKTAARAIQARRLLGRLEPDPLRRLLALCAAYRPEQAAAFAALQTAAGRLQAENACCRVGQLAVNGRDLMALGAKPGPGLRGQLEALLEAVITGQLPNERKALLAAVKIELDP